MDRVLNQNRPPDRKKTVIHAPHVETSGIIRISRDSSDAPQPRPQPRPVVALVRGTDRRSNLALALDLIRDRIRENITPDVVIKPNLVSHARQLPSTHAAALSAAVDAVRAAGGERIRIAEGATDATAGFQRMGYLRELAGQPVQFFNINTDETSWSPLDLVSVSGSPLCARVSDTMSRADYRVSLALAKTHMTAGLTMSIKNMLSCIHPEDRIMMHGYNPKTSASAGHGPAWKRAVHGFLKQDHVLTNILTRTLGRARWCQSLLTGKLGVRGLERLSAADRRFLQSVVAMHQNLVRLTVAVRPHLSLIDGWIGMHREGPRHGTPIPLKIAVAGTDPVAVDAVAAAAMGFDPARIGYLAIANHLGVGCCDLEKITIIGGNLADVKTHCIPHSNDPVQRHWDQFLRLSDENDNNERDDLVEPARRSFASV